MAEPDYRASAVLPLPSSDDPAQFPPPIRHKGHRGRLGGICAGLMLLAVASFWTHVPEIYRNNPDVPPLRDAKPQVSPSPSTPIAISMLQAHFKVEETGHQITWRRGKYWQAADYGFVPHALRSAVSRSSD